VKNLTNYNLVHYNIKTVKGVFMGEVSPKSRLATTLFAWFFRLLRSPPVLFRKSWNRTSHALYAWGIRSMGIDRFHLGRVWSYDRFSGSPREKLVMQRSFMMRYGDVVI